MWFFWWDGRNRRGGARFFWWMFFLFMFVNMMGAGFFWFMMLGLFFLFSVGAMSGVREFRNSMNETQRPSSSRRVDIPETRHIMPVPPPPMPVIRPEELAQDHALDAAILAGVNPQKASVLPIDIGVVAYRNDETTVHRTWRVDT
ncbi:MAG: hypothetical protein KJ043_23425, partial [Anaerolineae bacterium]|nr:hypothetical protein [Anaerolineae bacterium]